MMLTFLVDRVLKWLRAPSAPEVLHASYQAARESLQRSFFETAAATGLPRGLRWVRCDWLPEHVLIRHRQTGEIRLLAGVNISFEAIAGGEMEDIAAVSNIREATAVFQWSGRQWSTAGRTLFNLTPAMAAERFGSDYEQFGRS
jgi:hypothetical protein